MDPKQKKQKLEQLKTQTKDPKTLSWIDKALKVLDKTLLKVEQKAKPYVDEAKKDYQQFKKKMFEAPESKTKYSPEQKKNFKNFMEQFRGEHLKKQQSLKAIRKAQLRLRKLAFDFGDTPHEELTEGYSDWKNKLELALREDRANWDSFFSFEEATYDSPSDMVGELLDEGFDKFSTDQAHDAMIEIMEKLRSEDEK